MELSQEVVSVAVLLAVCVSLSCICLAIWFCRCRKDQVRQLEEKNERQMQMDNFNDQKKSAQASLTVPKNLSKKRTKTIEKEKSTVEEDLEASRSSHNDVHEGETIAEFESRIRDKHFPSGRLERIKEEERIGRLDTISDIAVSTASLERNDSKNNVFYGVKKESEEVDLNPGLNSYINLEKI